MRTPFFRCALSVGTSVLACVVVLGCYVPAPADPATIAQGANVNIVLTTEGMEHLGRVTPQVTREVTGQLMRLTPDSLTMTTRLATAGLGLGSAGDIRQAFTVARADIVEITVPELHRGRTLAVVGVSVAAAAWVLADLLDLGGVRGDGSDGPPDPGAPFWPR